MVRRAARLIPSREAFQVAQVPLLWTLALAATASFALLVTVHVGNASGWTAFEDVGETLAALIAALACGSRARRDRDRAVAGDSPQGAWRAWRLLAYGLGVWAVGHIARSVCELGFGINPKPPSVLDAAPLAAWVLVVGGLLSMVSTPAGRLSHLRGAAEGLLIATGCFLISWVAVIAAVFASSDTSTSGQIVNLAYPVLDAVALSGVLFVAARGKERVPPGLGLLGLGIACVAISDSAFWYLSALHPSFPRVSPIDIGWLAGFLVITMAAAQRPGPRQWMRRLAAGRLVPGLPTIPAAVGIATALASWLAGRSLGPPGVLLAISAALVVLALLLQLIGAYENQALTSDLERRVEGRTAELRATERYYRALVQQSSDVIMVVDPDLTVRYVSDSMETIFGHEPSALVGRKLEAVTGGSSALMEALNRTTIEAQHVSRVEWELTDATGRIRSAESAISNLVGDPNVSALVLNTRDATDQVALERQLRHQAFHDPLTGLANRALLADRAEQALMRSARSGASVAVVLVDLDGFKFVNDSLGHQVGDVVLGEVARRLESLVRSEDTVARLGGDEFVILIDDVGGMEETQALAERVRDVLRPHFSLPGWDYAVTASVGVAIGSASQVDVHDLLRDADTAMYVAKTSGKDSVRLFAPSMHARAHERFRLQVDLRGALEREELLLFYQPIYEMGDGRLKGFEALVRWSHPTRGLIAPERFIPLAEESGLIVPIGRWVLQQAIRQITSWDDRHAGARSLSISVNVSTVQLTAPSLIHDVQSELERSGIAPWRVVLEITEGSLAKDTERTIEVLQALRKLGLRIAIDDFGTGYASLSHLRRLPVDILKVDKSFVAALSEGGRSRELLEAILGVGRALSLAVVAEGIEAQSQMTVLQEMGCEMAQGFLVGKPSPAEVAESLLGADAAPAQIPSMASSQRVSSRT
ncbi:MAG TPA: EAL domain-containing protein [Solirubrobacteraceae bacterium]|jgi:diguanylate cyclase (GGDEF)-like protein/PAS domain S-box-containing protein|nr:EAL domain-containing protein [Solirubrobacteraceae bacterium]